jgi:hypothetical protein
VPESEYEIRLLDDGFKLSRKGRIAERVAWADVRGIAAFKRDLFTTDEICLGFRMNDNEYVVVSEEDAGFEALREYVESHFENVNRDWHQAVMLPAFARCWTAVWGDAPEPHDCARCGYDLRGLSDSRCPECGLPFGPGVCPACKGLREFRSFRLLKWGAPVAGGGLALVAAGRAPLMGGLASIIDTLGGVLLLAGLTLCVLELWEPHGKCRNCNGTGRTVPTTSPGDKPPA